MSALNDKRYLIRDSKGKFRFGDVRERSLSGDLKSKAKAALAIERKKKAKKGH